MSKLSIEKHISSQFAEELEHVFERILVMGDLVEFQVVAAVKSLVEGDSPLGERVVAKDVEVNALELSLDDLCSTILARRQPTASDLRLIIAAIKIVTDLERIGDEAEKVAKMGLHLATLEQSDKPYQDIADMGASVQAMIHGALDAFSRLDAALAVSVAASDKQVNAKYRSVVQRCTDLMSEDSSTVRRSLDVMWAARALERIGDHSRNICEYVIYLARGKDVRHISTKSLS